MHALTIPLKSEGSTKPFGFVTNFVRVPRTVPSIFSHFAQVIRQENFNKGLVRLACEYFTVSHPSELPVTFWFFAVACLTNVFSSGHRCSLTHTRTWGLRPRLIVETLIRRAFSSTMLRLKGGWIERIHVFYEGFVATGTRWHTSMSSAAIGFPVTSPSCLSNTVRVSSVSTGTLLISR